MNLGSFRELIPEDPPNRVKRESWIEGIEPLSVRNSLLEALSQRGGGQ